MTSIHAALLELLRDRLVVHDQSHALTEGLLCDLADLSCSQRVDALDVLGHSAAAPGHLDPLRYARDMAKCEYPPGCGRKGKERLMPLGLQPILVKATLCDRHHQRVEIAPDFYFPARVTKTP